MKCSRPNCPRPARWSGLCNPHLAWLAGQGERGMVNPRASRTHVLKLRELAWPNEPLSVAAGVSACAIRRLFERDRIRRATERGILSVPLVPYVSNRVSVSALGMVRRYQALAWMAWAVPELAWRMGSGPARLSVELNSESVSAVYFARFARLYDELSDTVGPNSQAAERARRLGFHPPMAWEYADIDDPKSRPFQGFREAA